MNGGGFNDHVACAPATILPHSLGATPISLYCTPTGEDWSEEEAEAEEEDDQPTDSQEDEGEGGGDEQSEDDDEEGETDDVHDGHPAPGQPSEEEGDELEEAHLYFGNLIDAHKDDDVPLGDKDEALKCANKVSGTECRLCAFLVYACVRRGI